MTASRQPSRLGVTVQCVPFAVDGARLLTAATTAGRSPSFPKTELGGQSLEDAARAALQSLGIEGPAVRQVGAYRLPRRPGVTVLYAAFATSQSGATPWHAVTDLPRMAADQQLLLDEALCRVREWTPIGDTVFDVLPPVFSLRELQDAWQALVGEPVDKRNFRRKALGEGWVEPAPSTTGSGEHRTGTQLYRAVRD